MSLASLIDHQQESYSNKNKAKAARLAILGFGNREAIIIADRQREVSNYAGEVSNSRKIGGERTLDNIQRRRRHAAHRRQQLFCIERLIEKLVSAHSVAGIASFDAARRSHDEDLGLRQVRL